MRDRFKALEEKQAKLVQVATRLQNQFLPGSKRVNLN
jgi:hypothetical protein